MICLGFCKSILQSKVGHIGELLYNIHSKSVSSIISHVMGTGLRIKKVYAQVKLSKMGTPKALGWRVRRSNVVRRATAEPSVGHRVARDLLTDVGALIVLGSRSRAHTMQVTASVKSAAGPSEGMPRRLLRFEFLFCDWNVLRNGGCTYGIFPYVMISRIPNS